jgi:phospholipase C
MEQEKRTPGMPEDHMRESPIGLGYRVPMIVASPWSRGGWVNSQVFDHTSCLQLVETFLEKKTGKKVKETNISDWRRTITGDLSSVFRPFNGEKYPCRITLKKIRWWKVYTKPSLRMPPAILKN